MDLLRRRYILIVDDNADLARSLAILLKLAGFDVTIAYNGHDALAMAASRRPDVLILDIGLPGLDGYEVARRFRNDERLKAVVIIALSAYPADQFPGRSRTRDFDHYLVKPADFRTLLPLLGRTG